MTAGRICAAILVLLVGFATQAQARGLLAPAEQTRLLSHLEKRPMVFFLAKGPAGACGPGCGEWIAAEGKFVPGTAQRLRDFLATLARHDLPIFFHSAGGVVGEAVRTGNILHERTMAAGVGRTTTEQCRVFARADPCQREIAAGAAIKAQLRAGEGQCHSACVIALVGASSRRVAAGALIGIHSARLDAKLKQEVMQRSPGIEITVSGVHATMEQYLAAMGIDPALQQLAAKVDARRLYMLSRDEIARFGIVPGERFETPWASFTDRNKQLFAIKAITRAVEGSEHRRVVAHFRCVRGRVFFVYQREVPSGETGNAAFVLAAVGAIDRMLARGPQKEASESWAVHASAQFLRNAATEPSIKLTEWVTPKGSAQAVSREIGFATAGLSQHIDAVVKACDAAKPPDAGKGETKS